MPCIKFPASTLISSILYLTNFTLPQQNDRWVIQADGGIEWKIDNRLPHNDHIEMSGEKVSLWMQYGVDTSGSIQLISEQLFFRLIACCRHVPSHI